VTENSPRGDCYWNKAGLIQYYWTHKKAETAALAVGFSPQKPDIERRDPKHQHRDGKFVATRRLLLEVDIQLDETPLNQNLTRSHY
jgi:hypothetical protein